MSNSLIEAAGYIPLCLDELTAWQKLSVALIREAAGLELQYGDLEGVLEVARKFSSQPLENPPENVVAMAQAIAKLPRFVGVVYLGIGVDNEEVECWVQRHDPGQALCDCGFLSGTTRPEVALSYGGSMLVRLLSCSGVSIAPISSTAQDDEVIFAPGERFIITAMQRRDFGIPHRRLWVIDAEEMYWPLRDLPHWPERDV